MRCVLTKKKNTKNTAEFHNQFVLTGQSLFGLLNQNSGRLRKCTRRTPEVRFSYKI